MLSPEFSLSACSCTALKKGPMPVPASSGSPSPLTKPPSRPVRRAWSKLVTADRNWGELCTSSGVYKIHSRKNTDLIMRWRTSAEGGLGRSGGRCGNSAGISSGWLLNSGVRFAGVRISVKDSSDGRRLQLWFREERETANLEEELARCGKRM